MNVLFLGPPGSGKGTQADLLVKKYDFKKFSMGDILREEVALSSSIGNKSAHYIKNGMLVPDEIIFNLVSDFLVENHNCHILFDGFPRTINQALNLEKILAQMNSSLNIALELQLLPDEIVKRLINRRYCLKCSRIYNYESNPPKRRGMCDDCGERLSKRDDDTEDVINKRLKIYEEETRPLVDYYKSLSIYNQIDARGMPHEIFEKISQVIDGHLNKR